MRLLERFEMRYYSFRWSMILPANTTWSIWLTTIFPPAPRSGTSSTTCSTGKSSTGGSMPISRYVHYLSNSFLSVGLFLVKHHWLNLRVIFMTPHRRAQSYTKTSKGVIPLGSSTQLSNLWWIPNSVCIGFGPAMKTGSSRRFKRYPTTHMWVSSQLPFTVD